MSDTDMELLARYTRQHAEDAFAELVRRHLGLVYSAALRQVRSPQLAEEVTQSVFIDLARSAAKLKPDTILTAWLYQVTRRTAIDVVRREASRQLREQIATEMNAMNATAADWTHIEPLLDEAMHALDDTDRAAVLLRYFENKSLREVGATLGTSENAAQKRLARAVEHLREFFTKRGVTVGASGLVVVISANAVQAAPAGLTVVISTAAALGGTTITATATATALKTIAMTVTQKVLVTAILAVAVGTGIYQARQASNARDLVNTLQQQQATLNEQIQQLSRERDEAARRLAAVPNDGGLNRAFAELLKLRGEVAGLRASALPNGGDPIQTAAQAWLARANQLKQYLEQHPEGKIPELQFVTEDDWLRATMSAFGTNNSGVTDLAYRQALVSVRNMGKSKFSAMARGALKSYALTHDGQFPADLSELKVHFAEPIDDAILQRYAIVPTATFKNTHVKGDWLMAEITSPDEDLDYRYLTGANDNDTVRFKQPFSKEEKAQMEAQMLPLVEQLMSVAKAYAAAHEGRPPPDAKEMIPYATSPEQQSALQKLIEIKNQGATGVSPTRHLIPQPANNGK